MGLAIVGARGDTVASVSIDGTIRQWSLKPEELRKAMAEKTTKEGEKEDEGEKKSMLTEEEERELAELMDSDDD
jgi:hypothetical protein